MVIRFTARRTSVDEPGRVLVVTPSVYALMKQSTDIVMETDVGNDMRLRGVIATLDGAAVMKIPAVRLPAGFGFMLAHPVAGGQGFGVGLVARLAAHHAVGVGIHLRNDHLPVLPRQGRRDSRCASPRRVWLYAGPPRGHCGPGKTGRLHYTRKPARYFRLVGGAEPP